MLRPAALWIAAGAVTVAVAAGLSQCSSDGGSVVGSQDGGVDGGMEGTREVTEATDTPDSSMDAPAAEDAPSAFGGGGSDASAIALCQPWTQQLTASTVAGWNGWQRLAALGPCCAAAVPTADAALPLPPYAWIPCQNGMAGCQQFATPWAQPHASVFSENGMPAASRGPDGGVGWLMFARTVDPAPYTQMLTWEYDLYDVGSGAPLGAWRVRNGLNPADAHYCIVQTRLGQSTASVTAYFVGDNGITDPIYLANGDPHTMTTAPRFAAYPLHRIGFQTTISSDSTFALDLGWSTFLARTDFGSTNVVLSPSTAVQLQLAMVEGRDVFGYSESGTVGWGQIYTFDASGGLSLLRSNAAAHVATPASDGARLYWTETYGSVDLLAQQTRTELWSAPYTTDPTQLAATASRFAVIPATALPLSMVAFGGLVALKTRGNIAYVARLSDGKVIQPDPGQGSYFSILVAVTPSELWSVVDVLGDYYGVSLTRISLGSW